MKRYRSKSGKYVALIPDPPAEVFSVIVTAWGVAAFNAGWPCSKLKERKVTFSYTGNGDLVDIVGRQQMGLNYWRSARMLKDLGSSASRRPDNRCPTDWAWF